MSLDINAANMEFTNEDETILSKLGIIQSTLECPKKKLNSKVGLKKVGGSHSASNANHNIQVSSDDSSDDCLFDNERFSQSRKRRRLQNKSVLRLDNGNSYKFTKWHILSFVSAFLFIGISATTRDLAIFSIPNSNSSDNASFFTGFSASFGFSYTIGCLLAVWNFHILSFNWTAFLAGTLLICIERGGLLVSSMCHNYQRMFFSLYMAVSLAALLNANSSGVLVSEDSMQFNTVSSPSKLLVKRDLGNLSALIYTTPNLLSVMNSTTQLSQNTSTTVASLQLNATTTIAPAVNKPIFSSKTEENMIRRKEVELRQKEKEKLMSTSTTAATTTTPAATSTSIITISTTTTPTTTTTSTTVMSTTTTPTTTPIASTTTSMITSPSTTSTTTISPPTQAMLTNASHLPGNISARPWTELAVVPSHTTQTCLTMLLIVLPVPLLLAFCCCQMSTSTLPDARMLEMFSKSKERTALDAEPVGCKVLSFWCGLSTLL
uniref:Uncharacterized protein n=1 Tax=Ditylenchus dipsaci TaxID=166011 RepID=A0A915EI73_9BILA